MRRLAHRAVDDGFDHLMQVRSRPAWQPVPDEVVARLHTAAPRAGEGAESAYADFRSLVLPYPMGNTHPRFWAWFMGNGTPFAAVADFLAAIVNPNMGGGNHVANHVEAQVVDWCREIVGFPVGVQWPARQWRLDGEFRRARGRAQRTCRGRCQAARPGRRAAAVADLRVRRGAQLRAEGDRVPRARGVVAAQGAGQRRLRNRRSGARADDS